MGHFIGVFTVCQKKNAKGFPVYKGVTINTALHANNSLNRWIKSKVNDLTAKWPKKVFSHKTSI